MPFVMVPVPEEYVTDVMQLVVDMTRGAPKQDGAQWDKQRSRSSSSMLTKRAGRCFRRSHEECSAGTAVTDEYAAGVLQRDIQDTVAIIEQINAAVRARRACLHLITRQNRLLSMPADVARTIRAAEDEER